MSPTVLLAMVLALNEPVPKLRPRAADIATALAVVAPAHLALHEGAHLAVARLGGAEHLGWGFGSGPYGQGSVAWATWESLPPAAHQRAVAAPLVLDLALVAVLPFTMRHGPKWLRTTQRAWLAAATWDLAYNAAKGALGQGGDVQILFGRSAGARAGSALAGAVVLSAVAARW